MNRRKPIPGGMRMRILRKYNFQCIYCGGQATVVDHIVPYSWTGKHDEDNLAPACETCNQLLSDLVFDTIAEKISYVRNRRKQKGLPVSSNQSVRIKLIIKEPNDLQIPISDQSYKEAEENKRLYRIPDGEDWPEGEKHPGVDEEFRHGLLPEIWEFFEKLGSWEKVGLHYGIESKKIRYIAEKEYMPITNPLRRKLGLCGLIDPIGELG